MQQDTLDEILEAEKEIKDMLDGERKRADQWLEQTKLEIATTTKAKIAKVAESVTQSKGAAKKAAEATAAEIVQQALFVAQRIESLEEDRLQRIVWEHIVEYIAGTQRDH